MQVQIIFISTGANSAFGGFTSGDRARVSADLARHFVDDCGVAVYATKSNSNVVTEKVAPKIETPPIIADATKRKGKK